MKRSLLWFLLMTPIAYQWGCGAASPTSLTDEAWNNANNPVIMGYNKLKAKYQYTNVLQELPLKAQLAIYPWTSDYWPNHRGGASYRWQAGNAALKKFKLDNPSPSSQTVKKVLEPFYSYELGLAAELPMAQLSPTEKYDLLRQDSDFSLTRTERRRTSVMKTVEGHAEFDADYKIPSWYGLCHAWAPAAYLFQAVADVQVSNPAGEKIYFTAGDIQALFAVFLDKYSPLEDTQFLGGRCEASFKELVEKYQAGTITEADYMAAVNDSRCRDTNAGSFHIVLANQIGRLKEPFIADVTRDREVWNQPVVAFESRLISEMAPNAQAAPGTEKMVLVKSVMYYVKTGNPSITGKPRYAYDFGTYTYYLELDAQGAIIGGQWVESKSPSLNSSLASRHGKDRPDFLWKRTLPKFSGTFTQLEPLYESARQVYEKRGYKNIDPITDMPAAKRQLLEAFWK